MPRESEDQEPLNENHPTYAGEEGFRPYCDLVGIEEDAACLPEVAFIANMFPELQESMVKVVNTLAEEGKTLDLRGSLEESQICDIETGYCQPLSDLDWTLAPAEFEIKELLENEELQDAMQVAHQTITQLFKGEQWDPQVLQEVTSQDFSRTAKQVLKRNVPLGDYCQWNERPDTTDIQQIDVDRETPPEEILQPKSILVLPPRPPVGSKFKKIYRTIRGGKPTMVFVFEGEDGERIERTRRIGPENELPVDPRSPEWLQDPESDPAHLHPETASLRYPTSSGSSETRPSFFRREIIEDLLREAEQNEAIDIEPLIQKYMNDPDRMVRLQVIRYTADPRIHRQILKSAGPEDLLTKYAIAQHSENPLILAELAQNEDTALQFLIATNSETDLATLKIIINNDNVQGDVRASALKTFKAKRRFLEEQQNAPLAAEFQDIFVSGNPPKREQFDRLEDFEMFRKQYYSEESPQNYSVRQIAVILDQVAPGALSVGRTYTPPSNPDVAALLFEKGLLREEEGGATITPRGAKILTKFREGEDLPDEIRSAEEEYHWSAHGYWSERQEERQDPEEPPSVSHIPLQRGSSKGQQLDLFGRPTAPTYSTLEAILSQPKPEEATSEISEEEARQRRLDRAYADAAAVKQKLRNQEDSD